MPQEGSKGRAPSIGLTFAVPTGAVLDDQRWTCGTEYYGEKSTIMCGCPACLAVKGLTVIFTADSMKKHPEDPQYWIIRIVARQIAEYAPEQIAPGYRGCFGD